MMGTTHGLTGAAAGAWTLPLLQAATGPVEWQAQAAWVVTCTGFAMLPDIDTKQSSVSRLWGPITRAGSWAVTRFTGHRGWTHSLAAPAAAWALVALLALTPYGPAVVFALAFGLTAVVFDRVIPGDQRAPLVNLSMSVLAGSWAWWTDVNLDALPWAAALGVAVHLLGDAVTKRGALGLIKADGPWNTVVSTGAVLALAGYAVTVLA